MTSLVMSRFAEACSSYSNARESYLLEKERADSIIQDLQIKYERSNGLLKALGNFTGLQHAEFLQEENGNMKLQLKLEKVAVVLILDNIMRVSDMETTSGNDILNNDLRNKILTTAKALPPPQDIRHVIFSLNAIQFSKAAVQNHIMGLKKKCIVRQSKDPYKVQLTLSNGISMTLKANEFYPEVPGGIHIESLYGVGGWDSQELENTRLEVNGSAHCSMIEIVDELSLK